MIPLINIVFLLLVFYMIAGGISTVLGDHVDPPFSNSGQALEGASIVLVLDKDNVLSMNGDPVELNGLATSLFRKRDMAPNRIVLKADKEVKAIHLSRVLNVLREHQVSTVALLSLPRNQGL